jgi:hypothetical protein
VLSQAEPALDTDGDDGSSWWSEKEIEWPEIPKKSSLFSSFRKPAFLNRTMSPSLSEGTSNRPAKRYHQLPFELLSENFTAREYELEYLDVRLTSRADMPPTSVAVLGLPGVGKSQVALKYAHLHRDIFDVIIWINASSETKYEQSFKRAAMCLDLATGYEADKKCPVKVIKWLKSATSKWLVIYDDVGMINVPLDPWMRKRDRGSILFTSRNFGVLALSDSYAIEVKTLSKENSFALLARSLQGSMGLAMEMIRDARSIPEDIQTLLDTLDGHPLAISEAAKFLDCCYSRCSMSEFAKYATELGDPRVYFYDSMKVTYFEMYKEAMARTWNKALCSLDRDCLRLLHAICFFDHRNISDDFIHFHYFDTILQPNGSNCRDFRKQIQYLGYFSLVQYQLGSPNASLHILLKSHMLHSMDHTQLQESFDLASEFLLSHFPRLKTCFTSSGLSMYWKDTEIYLTHLSALLTCFKQNNTLVPSTTLLTLVLLRCLYKHSIALSSAVPTTTQNPPSPPNSLSLSHLTFTQSQISYLLSHIYSPTPQHSIVSIKLAHALCIPQALSQSSHEILSALGLKHLIHINSHSNAHTHPSDDATLPTQIDAYAELSDILDRFPHASGVEGSSRVAEVLGTLKSQDWAEYFEKVARKASTGTGAKLSSTS